jgi:hypothetical protein
VTIVVGYTRGIRRRTAVGKMLMGSNAHRILMALPVLAVKAADHD